MPATRRAFLACAAQAPVWCAPAAWAALAAASEGVQTVDVAGCRIQLQLEGEAGDELQRQILVWLKRSAQCVAAYLGQFPVKELPLRMQLGPGQGVGGGRTLPTPQPNIRLRVGRDTTAAQFMDDWVLVHEMIHLAIPDVMRNQNWLHEGIATYVETVARARAGITQPAQAWGELARGTPQGQPQAGDRGLDHTPTWGRTYWGGAMFCLLADVQMLRQSEGRAGLRQALAGVLKAGGNYAVDWPAERTLSVADAAVGMHVLSEQYQRMKDQPVTADLDDLWRKLGVSRFDAGNATLLDDAPWGPVRRAITG
jgi:hypothetical protein